jgi:hypothetical protein
VAFYDAWSTLACSPGVSALPEPSTFGGRLMTMIGVSGVSGIGMKHVAWVSGIAMAALPVLVGCGHSPECAGSAGIPTVSVSLDARNWMQAHPRTAVVVACTESYPCRRMSPGLLDRPSVFVGNAPGSSPRGALVRLRVRALTAKGRVLFKSSAAARPKITNGSSPCGPIYSASAKFVLSADGHLSAAR